MNNKYRQRITIWILGLWICAGCVDDPGNYDYREPGTVMPVRIEGLEDAYTFKMWTEEHLTPEVKGIGREEDYLYTWYLLPKGADVSESDTLCRTKNLSCEVTCESGNYDLVYEIKDKKTGVFVNKRLELTVASVFSHAWYVVKDENGKTDVDLIYPDGRVEGNQLLAKAGVQLDGQGVMIDYQSTGYYHEERNEDGTVTLLTNKKALHVLSDRDIKVFNADNLSLFKKFEDVFYDAPAQRAPQYCANGRGDLYFLNAGRLHTIMGIANVGKVSLAISGDYDLFPGMLYTLGGGLVFDQLSRSFYSVHPAFPELLKIADPVTSDKAQVSPNRMNAQVVAILQRNRAVSQTGYILMKNVDPVKEEYYLGDVDLKAMGRYPFADFDTLPSDNSIGKAKVWGAHMTSSCIYFGLENRLYAHTIADIAQREQEIHTFPVGETISYIAHMKSTDSRDSFNHLIVMTNSNSGWKMYRFNFEGDTATLLDEPLKPFEGKGAARYVMFRLG